MYAAICLVFSSNLWHADMSQSAMLRWLSRDLPEVLKCLRKIPCSVSLEGLDCELLPALQGFYLDPGKAEVISREWAHPFSDWLSDTLALKNFTLCEDTHPVQFSAEYSIPSKSVTRSLVKQRGEVAFYMLDKFTRFYSTDFSSVDMPVNKRMESDLSAMEYEGAVLMRMRSRLFEPILRAWYSYQARPSPEALAKLEAVIALKLRDADRRGIPVIFVPMDIESCVVGSHHGSEVFVNVIEMIMKAGFPLVTPTQAYHELRGQAVHTDLRPGRSTFKWEGSPLQGQLRKRWRDAVMNLIPTDVRATKIALMAAGSDGFVVERYQSEQSPASIPTLAMPIRIGGANHAAYLLQQYAISTYFRAEDLLKKIQLNRQELALLDLAENWLSV